MQSGLAPTTNTPAVPGRGRAQTKSQQIVAALVLPGGIASSSWPSVPLPVPDLQQLPRDGSMLYDIGRVDASGRVAAREIIGALDWQPGNEVEVVIANRAIVMRARPGGLVTVPARPCVVIPVTARRHRGIHPGDRVLLAAAPEQGIVIVHTLSDLDEMLTGYHSDTSLAS